jgi:hypothetical protein
MRLTEKKYAHVTYFFNGGVETLIDEDRICYLPRKCDYDLKPEMSAYEVSGEVFDALQTEPYNLIVDNSEIVYGPVIPVLPAAVKLWSVDDCSEKYSMRQKIWVTLYWLRRSWECRIYGCSNE